ncbi:hypothetical protein AN286_06875 [Aliarcobacter cryaerophilus ATCC 43158]|uniref:Bacteriophage CI repressor N-terminal domain-containing protein n=1 Tax=Aliarcobacter cryaerophilus ATCC 43158 TaxID=1032070 RepID=A0AAD0TS05_9BACT|nr:helix-turn-helix transcriptional regulator [Aliarcobacter cryaerophilus]AYJ79891.1 hypothetical protein ACRYA_0753 [Aliarcobacter cryaerophilus ATCC 43158]PRM96892.1 hypothetical protein CJ667_06705 [Aliarcobacter cryaerophilus]QCZ24124.1 hypothetical protein AN286_06875 [Aliarcobacter cryaerophilus ATCC 43158]
MDFDTYFEKLFNFYNVSTIKELSQKIGIGASTISAWNQRKSISALKKACRELNIYNDIFGNIDNKILEALNKEQQDEIKNSIDEDTMFHIQNLFTIAKRKNLLKELKTELSMMYLKYSTYDKDSKTEDGRNIFNDNIIFEAPEKI